MGGVKRDVSRAAGQGVRAGNNHEQRPQTQGSGTCSTQQQQPTHTAAAPANVEQQHPPCASAPAAQRSPPAACPAGSCSPAPAAAPGQRVRGRDSRKDGVSSVLNCQLARPGQNVGARVAGPSAAALGQGRTQLRSPPNTAANRRASASTHSACALWCKRVLHHMPASCSIDQHPPCPPARTA